jgi:hypothetical protein
MKEEDLVMVILWGIAVLFSLVYVVLCYKEKNKKSLDDAFTILFTSLTPFGCCMTIGGLMFGLFYGLDKAYKYFFNKLTKDFT